jgi:hypothetical protein
MELRTRAVRDATEYPRGAGAPSGNATRELQDLSRRRLMTDTDGGGPGPTSDPGSSSEATRDRSLPPVLPEVATLRRSETLSLRDSGDGRGGSEPRLRQARSGARLQACSIRTLPFGCVSTRSPRSSPPGGAGTTLLSPSMQA